MKKLVVGIINIVLAFFGFCLFGCVCGVILWLTTGDTGNLQTAAIGFVLIMLLGIPLVNLKDKLTKGSVNTMRALMKELFLTTIALVAGLFGFVAVFLGWHTIESLIKGNIDEAIPSVLGAAIIAVIAYLLSRLKNKLSSRNSSEDL